MNTNKKNKDIILFVGKIFEHMVESVKEIENNNKQRYKIAFLYDSRLKLKAEMKEAIRNVDIAIQCDFHDPSAIQKALLPYNDQLLAVTCRGEDQIPNFAKIIPHVPYLRTPTSESLNWATDKLLMRRRLRIHNKKITPAYAVVTNTDKISLNKIEKQTCRDMLSPPRIGESFKKCIQKN